MKVDLVKYEAIKSALKEEILRDHMVCIVATDDILDLKAKVEEIINSI